MKITAINSRYHGGGAAAVAATLAKTLAAVGHESRMLTGSHEPTPPDVTAVPLPWRALLPYHTVNLLGMNYFGITGVRRWLNHPFVRTADVVHLHNIHGGFFNPLWLNRLSRTKPLVWTLHDMWPLTGHCAHSFDCERWKTGCGYCPYPCVYPPIRHDATRWEWRLKRNIYQRSNITLISPSRWLATLVSQSFMTHFPIQVIPNAIDTSIYTPQPSADWRRKMKIASDQHVLLFVAENINSPFKHFEFIPLVIEHIPSNLRRHMTLLVMGARPPANAPHLNVNTRYLGPILSATQKAEVFSAASLLVYPTRADNFPVTIQEALACGCPIVAEDVGGVGELVRSGVTGFLAPPNDAHAFADGISQLCTDPQIRSTMQANCRAIAVAEYSMDLHVQRICAVYEKTVNRFHHTHNPAPTP